MSKSTNDGLPRSGTGCFIAVPIQQQWVSNGLTQEVRQMVPQTQRVHELERC